MNIFAVRRPSRRNTPSRAAPEVSTVSATVGSASTADEEETTQDIEFSQRPSGEQESTADATPRVSPERPKPAPRNFGPRCDCSCWDRVLLHYSGKFIRWFDQVPRSGGSIHDYCAKMATKQWTNAYLAALVGLAALALSIFVVVVQIFALWAVAYASVGQYQCRGNGRCFSGMYCHPESYYCNGCSQIRHSESLFEGEPEGEDGEQIYYRAEDHPDEDLFWMCDGGNHTMAKAPLQRVWDSEPRFIDPVFFPQTMETDVIDLSQMGSDATVDRAITSIWRVHGTDPDANTTSALWCAAAAHCELTDSRPARCDYLVEAVTTMTGGFRSVIITLTVSFLLAAKLSNAADQEAACSLYFRKRAHVLRRRWLKWTILALGEFRGVLRTYVLAPATLAATSTLLLTRPLNAASILLSFLSTAYLADVDIGLGFLFIPAWEIERIKADFHKLEDLGFKVRWLEHRIIITIVCVMIALSVAYAEELVMALNGTDDSPCDLIAGTMITLALILSCGGGVLGSVLELLAHRTGGRSWPTAVMLGGWVVAVVCGFTTIILAHQTASAPPS